MSYVYCQECGAKHVLGAKFCSSCGNPFDKRVSTAKQSKRTVESTDEDGAAQPLVIPSKLEYDITDTARNRYSVEEILKTPPSNSADLRPRPNNVRNLSESEYLSESLRECAPAKKPEEIDES